MQGFPYMTQVGLGSFLGIAMPLLSVVLFCNQRQFSADARIIQQHERLCMLSDSMADVEGLPLSILNDKPFEIADNGAGKPTPNDFGYNTVDVAHLRCSDFCFIL